MREPNGEFWSKKKKVRAAWAVILFILLFISAKIWPSPIMIVVVIGIYLIATIVIFMNELEDEFWNKKRKIYACAISLFILLFISAAIWPSPIMFVAVIGVYLIATFGTFIFFTTEYYVNMLSYRKGFYLTFFVSLKLIFLTVY